MSEERKYGIILEWKNEGPLIMEGQLLTRDEAQKKMVNMMGSSRVIRCAVFEARYEYGNETLLPKAEL